MNAAEELLSVGDIAEATGIAPATLRVWERRYGYPKPVRLPSGHRRYTVSQRRRLIRIAEAMSRGHRVGSLLQASEDELDRLLDATRPDIPRGARAQGWLAAVVEMRGNDLARELLASARDRDPVEFLEADLVPLLHEIGRGWADGTIEVRHEHLATQVIQDVLHDLRAGRASDPAPTRGLLLLATLPGERHGIGLQMAAVLAQSACVRYRILGVDTPVEEIAAAAGELGAEAVGISVSLSGGGVETDRVLARLREALPADTDLVVGGDGARRPRRGARGVTYVPTLREFDAWLRRREWLAAADPRGLRDAT